VSSEERAFLATCTNAILRGIKANNDEVRRIIAVYDDAYAGLIERQEPKMFREFLVSASAMFLEIGEKMGTMSHIASFWQYRFPAGTRRAVGADELTAIFQDFAKSFGVEVSVV
jgi:hypothetical protein